MEMAEKYNELHPEVQIKVEASHGGWMTKVVGQIRSDELEWSAAGIMAPAAWVQLGLVQPIDDYLADSTEEGTSAFLSDMLVPVKVDEVRKGKMDSIPFRVEKITYPWNTEWFGFIKRIQVVFGYQISTPYPFPYRLKLFSTDGSSN